MGAQKVVHKYPINTGAGDLSIELPVGAEILSVGFQYGVPVAWALVDPEVTEMYRKPVVLINTGYRVQADELGAYIGRLATPDGALQIHIFEAAS